VNDPAKIIYAFDDAEELLVHPVVVIHDEELLARERRVVVPPFHRVERHELVFGPVSDEHGWGTATELRVKQ
jgi:hypothetical protein